MADPVLDLRKMNRLAFIRLLYQQSIEQARLPEPLNATGVLSLHDASELFLVLAAEQLRASLPKVLPFMDYWKLLSPAKLPGGISLPAQQRMSRVNDLRNALKHHGTLPSAVAVEQAVEDVRTFLEDSVQAVFGIPFSGIDMTDVVAQDSTRARLKAAARAEAEGDRKEAMALLAEALTELFDSPVRAGAGPAYAFGMTVNGRMTLGSVSTMISALANGLPRPQDQRGIGGMGRALDHHLGELAEAVRAMQRGMRVIALGVDYARYDRFEQLTPTVWGSGEHRQVQAHPLYAPTREEYDDCVQFVISVALRMAELEAHTAQPSWLPAWGPA